MRDGRPVSYTRHTRERLLERRIDGRWVEAILDASVLERRIDGRWVEAILDASLLDEPDPAGDGRRRCWGRVPAFGDRMLRIVYVAHADGIRVITVTPDRNRGRRTP